MSHLFYRSGYDVVMKSRGWDFNDDISAWNTSNVTNMESMFNGAKAFNQPIGEWRVDNVTNMSGMFARAAAFNQPLNDWRVDKVTDMFWMFTGASAFDQPLGDWRLRCDCRTEGMFDKNFRNSRPVKASCCAIS